MHRPLKSLRRFVASLRLIAAVSLIAWCLIKNGLLGCVHLSPRGHFPMCPQCPQWISSSPTLILSKRSRPDAYPCKSAGCNKIGRGWGSEFASLIYKSHRTKALLTALIVGFNCCQMLPKSGSRLIFQICVLRRFCCDYTEILADADRRTLTAVARRR